MRCGASDGLDGRFASTTLSDKGQSCPAEDDMRNPYGSKNPFMSAWLSAANRAMGSARAQGVAETKRQVAALQAETAKQILDFWSGRTFMSPPRKKKRSR